jgi:hypothetical protein
MIHSIVRPPLRVRAAPTCLLAATLACISPHVLANNLFTVGGDAACSFHDLQQAIDASTASDFNSILIARNFTYSGQHLVVNGQIINFLGGLETCDGTVYGDPIPITGAAGHSVIEIEGNSQVYISKLDISGADLDGSHKGGGIYFGGSGALQLVNVSVHDNRAGYGGGIDMSPSGAATLTLDASLIANNVASGQGGGIRLEGPAQLVADTNTYITGNTATGQDDVGYGGGIELVGPASATVNANLNNNTATYGGGIAALASGGNATTVNVYSTSANVVALYGNTATATGGGLYLKSSREGSLASACANDFLIDQNTAPNGSAIYADADDGVGSVVYLNSSSCPRPADGVACASGPLCNEIADNASTDAGSATMMVQSNGALFADRFAARRNQGGRLVELIADTDIASAVLENCLLADNVMSSNLLWANGGADETNLFVHSCTLTHNQLGSSDPVIYADVHRLEVTDTIVDQPPNTSLAFTGSSDQLFTQYVLTNDTGSFVGGTGILAGTPLFVDAANGDYHLQRSSPGIDEAPAADGLDLDGNPRTVDLADIPNDFGPTDLGAYEIQTQLPPPSCAVADTIYCNGFEDL